MRRRTEPGWRPDAETYCEPDIVLFPKRLRHFGKVPGSDVLLLVEVADSTLKYDTAKKAPPYARLGVREYWVINAVNLDTRVHRKPTSSGYGYRRKLTKDALLTPTLLPELALRLTDLATALD